MGTASTLQIGNQLQQFDAEDPGYASQFVECLLRAGHQHRASDIHVQPLETGLEVRLRMDGVLHSVGAFPRGVRSDPISRLKVLADLLTYRRDVPQEGRIRESPNGVEMRVSTFPTLGGERAVVRFVMTGEQPWTVADLGLPTEIGRTWPRLLAETSGMLVITGPAGSGKTTTAYASLRQIVADSRGGRSVVTLEDPVEAVVQGVAQSQVNSAAGFTFAAGLRSLMRQDPEVILMGEIRDAETARISFQAALTGQLVVTTFHAGSAAAAINRLGDMGIEPYILRSGIQCVLGQRLLRRLCACARESADPADRLGLAVSRTRVPVGCETCLGTGYVGRMILAEMLMTGGTEVGGSILNRDDAAALEAVAVAHGMRTRWRQAADAVDRGATSAAEVRRVLGWRET